MSFYNTSSRSKNLHPNSVRIGLMDPNIAQTWAQRVLSNGTTVASIKKGDTINHTTSQPIANGLFCQRIFGPCNDYTCACGHEKIRIHANVNVAPPVCPECHVEWTVSSVRRQRLGSIELLSPVTHKWFSDSRNYIPILSGINVKTYKSLKECKLFFPFVFQVVDTNPSATCGLTQVTHGLPPDKKKNFKKPYSVSSMPRFRPSKGSRPSVGQEEFIVTANIPKENRVGDKISVSKDVARSMKNLQIMTKSLLWSLDQERPNQDDPPVGMLTRKNSTFYTLVSTTEILQRIQYMRYLGFVPTVNNHSSSAEGQVGQPLSLSTVAQLSPQRAVATVGSPAGSPKVGDWATPGRSWPTLPTCYMGYPSFTKARVALRSKLAVQVKDESSVKQKKLVSDRKSSRQVVGLIPQRSKHLGLAYLWSPISCGPFLIQAKKEGRELLRAGASPAKENIRTLYGLTLKNVKKTLLSFSSNRHLKNEIIPVLRKTVKKQLKTLPNQQDIVYSDNFNSTEKQNQQNADFKSLCTIYKNPINKTSPTLSNRQRSKEHVEQIHNLILEFSKIKDFNFKEKVLKKNAVKTKVKFRPAFSESRRSFSTFGNKNQNFSFPQPLQVFPSVPPVVRRPSEVNPLFEFFQTQRASIKNRAGSSQVTLWDGSKSTVGRRLIQGSKLRLGTQKFKLSQGSSGFNLGSEMFNCYHSSPTRPSFTQPEDYRRQFIKFMGTTGLTHSMDVPIVRYTHKNLLNFTESHQNLLQRRAFSTPLLQTTYDRRWCVLPHDRKNCFAGYHSPSHLWPARIEKQLIEKETYKSTHLSLKHGIQPSIDVFFSETKSAAKEETIKTILLQTGGGGIQQYLENINIGMLIFMLQNDLFEIAPRLVKSQSTQRILAFIVNKILKNIHQNYRLLEQIQTGSAFSLPKAGSVRYPVQVKVEATFVPSSTESAGNSMGERNDRGRNKQASRPDSRQVANTNSLSLVAKIENLEKRYKELKKEYKIVKKISSDFQNRKNANKRRYKLAFQLFRTMSNPAGMTLSSVPVLPPGLRPIIDVPKIGPITADLNIRYRALIFALRNLRELAYVDFRNTGAAQASVQEAVDDLLYTGGKTRREKGNMAMSQNLYKSLAIRLKGKHGRFRGNLLGKRVDYSGRSVIVVGPTLKIYQCGLPFEIAIKLFNPFLIRRLIQKGLCKNVYKAKQVLMSGKFKPLIWALCREVMLEHLVLLNRAPTLHRLGVQAFMPLLVSGRAILLHPLVCTGFNADFDGDQMGVHVPLFSHPRAEAWKMMWSRNNFLSPSSGEPILLPSQDMVLGCYYLTESFLGELPLAQPTQRPFTPLRSSARDLALARAKELYPLPVQGTDSDNISETTNHYFRPNNFIKSFNTTSQVQNSHVLSVKTILENYRRGFYTLQSTVWINSNKMVKKLEGGGFEGKIPALELRITPYGITRMLHPSGIKKSFFSNSTLLPIKKNSNSPFEICSIRTTIGRLLFNDVLNQFDIF